MAVELPELTTVHKRSSCWPARIVWCPDEISHTGLPYMSVERIPTDPQSTESTEAVKLKVKLINYMIHENKCKKK